MVRVFELLSLEVARNTGDAIPAFGGEATRPSAEGDQRQSVSLKPGIPWGSVDTGLTTLRLAAECCGFRQRSLRQVSGIPIAAELGFSLRVNSCAFQDRSPKVRQDRGPQ